MVPAAACGSLGLLLAYAGWRLIKQHEKPVETTGFHTAPWSRTFGYCGGYGLLFLGLMLAFVYAPMAWIARMR